MRPEMRDGDRRGAFPRRARQPVVTGIAVQLQGAIEALQDLFRVLPGAAGSIGEHCTGRVITAPSAVVPGQRPEIPGLCPAAAWVQNRRRGLVHEQLARSFQVLRQPVDYGAEVEGGCSNPIGERAAVQVDPGAGQDLALAV